MTAEQRGLLEKARRSVDSASVLLDRGDYDFAASRAYYAMFYVAEALLLSKGLSFSKHSAVLSAFGREFVKTGIVDPIFHRYLRESGDTRNVSDYDIGPMIQREDVTLQISRAMEFLDLARRFIGPC